MPENWSFKSSNDKEVYSSIVFFSLLNVSQLGKQPIGHLPILC